MQSVFAWGNLPEPEDVVIETLIARAPALLMLIVLALLVWVALLQRDQLELLAAGVPATVVLVLYLRAGRGGRGGGAP